MNRQEERAALLVIDLERGFIDESSPLCIRDAAATLPACGQAITYAREEGVPVFFIHRAYRADGSDVEACRYNMDTNRVEARFADGFTVVIDCIAVENEYGNIPKQRAELDWLLYNKPLEYVQLVLRGEIEHYLSLGCDHGRMED